jgi:hypothetical protein
LSSKQIADRAGDGRQAIVQAEEQRTVLGIGQLDHQRRLADDEKHVEGSGQESSDEDQ